MGFLTSTLADVLAPRVCAGCQEEGSWFCASCTAALPWDANIRCIGCDRLARWGATCDRCRPDFPLDGVLAMVAYDIPAIRRFVHLVKYAPARDAAGAYPSLGAAWMEHGGRIAGVETVGPTPCIVPVPLHRRRERERGFNQSALLADALATHLGAVGHPALHRTRATPPQAELHRTERLKNVTNAFACPDPASVRGRSVLLIDDVVTTGATFAACARALRDAGARTVVGLALARG